MTVRLRHIALALAGILLVALLLRLPHLQLVPHLTDEAGEVEHAYAIAFHGARPLTHADAYYGPFWPYLLAAVMAGFGPALPLWLPRAFALALGLLTIVATFALGWRLAAGLTPGTRLQSATIAGLLLATHFTHSLVNSRVAWSNSSTPLWTTLTALALLRAIDPLRGMDPSGRSRDRRDAGGPWLVLAGALGGLALHTHPGVILYLAGLAIWFLLDRGRRSWLRTRWPWLALGAALLAYSPMIVFNLGNGFETLRQAEASTNAVATSSAIGWTGGMVALIAQLGRSMAGGFLPAGLDRAWDWASWLYGLVMIVAALIVAIPEIRKTIRARTGATVEPVATREVEPVENRQIEPSGRSLPAVVFLVALVGLPLFNRNYQGFLEARYIMFLAPLLVAAFGAVVAGALQGASREARWVCLLAIGLLAAVPAMRVVAYDRVALAEQFDNRRLLAMAEVARDAVTAGDEVLVDQDLKSVTWRAGGQPRRGVGYYLTIGGIPFQLADPSKINYFVTAGGRRRLLFLAGETATMVESSHPLEALDVMPRPGEGEWGMYRAGP